MKRSPALLFAAVLAVGCAGPAPRQPAPQSAPVPPWTMEGGDPGRTSRGAPVVPERWQVERMIDLVEKDRYSPLESASPLLIEGAAYVGHTGRRFEAILSDGSRLWSVATKGRVYTTAALVDGLLVFGDDEGIVQAVDLTGDVRWRFPVSYPVVSSPLSADGKVFVAVSDQNVFGLEAATGRPLWQYGRRFPRRNVLWRSLGLSFGEGRVYAGFSDGAVVALDAELGRVLWRADIGAAELFGDVAAGPSYRDGRVYAGVSRGPVVCLDAATGEEVWRANVEAAAGFAVGDEVLYVATVSGGVSALSRADGRQLWETALDGGAATAPVLAGGFVVAGASEGSLLVLDATTGEIRGRYWPGSGLRGQPTASGGQVLFLSNRGVLHWLR